ncbi:MAG: hypothetical protein BWX80_01476 [Candidatus Hydrogenedentes bacterium ADurb.Bin101]|nr:MAG: hypothetical protein BWX80_01476 [Candidatus Hydrogenedentes bacterium ADurb.Bin101]
MVGNTIAHGLKADGVQGAVGAGIDNPRIARRQVGRPAVGTGGMGNGTVGGPMVVAPMQVSCDAVGEINPMQQPGFNQGLLDKAVGIFALGKHAGIKPDLISGGLPFTVVRMRFVQIIELGHPDINGAG